MRYLLPVFLLLVMVLPAQAAPPAQGQLAASIEVITPGVDLKLGGTETWHPITGSAVVAAGDTIRTNESGSALVVWFADGTMMDIEPETELVIDEFSGIEDGPYSISTSIRRGRVLHTVERLLDTQSSYTVNTPNVSAAVRGTAFAVEVGESTLFIVNVGNVETRINGVLDSIPVQGGQVMQVLPPADPASDIPAYEVFPIETTNLPQVQQLDERLRDFALSRGDRDGDGLIDFVDQCPDVPGHLYYRGCPGEVPREIGAIPGLQVPTATPTRATATEPPTRATVEGQPTRAVTSTPTDGRAPTASPTETPMPTTATDRDGDGVPDDVDRCPSEFGPASNDGCPLPTPTYTFTPLPDRDGDGVPDQSDECPGVPGPPSNAGCPLPTATYTATPLPDRDGDGVPDQSDKCPGIPGPPSNAGCPLPTATYTATPLPDRDGDGVPDQTDQCPGVPGPPSNAGCPLPTATATPRV